MKFCFDHSYNFLLVLVIYIKIEPSPIQNGRELLQLSYLFYHYSCFLILKF